MFNQNVVNRRDGSVLRRIGFAALLCFAFTLRPLRAQDVTCTNSIMNGTYMLTATGIVTTPAGPMPITVVGKVSYFGDGTGKATFSTTSVGGNISRLSTPVSAVYSVNSDCTGTKVFGGVQHYDFVIAPNGRQINFIVTDAGVTLSGVAVRMDNRD